ncbi:MAG: hypothetical protein KAX05_00865 [Bacteroidales bacterium]|nr:hypothetical protein [Bacteroidales bacterium]
METLKRIFFFILLFFLIATSSYAVEDSLLLLLPCQDEINNFEAISKPEVYNSENLFDIINGEADVYLEYGFDKMVFQNYGDIETENIVRLEIYRMIDSDGAYGVLTLYAREKTLSEGNGTFFVASNDYALIQKGMYYISITVSGPSARFFKQEISKLANFIESKIEKISKIPDIITDTKQLCRKPERLLYFRGGIALSDAIYLETDKLFDFHEGVYYRCDDTEIAVFMPKNIIKTEEMLYETLSCFSSNPKYKIEKNNNYWLIKSGDIINYRIYLFRTMIILEKRFSTLTS